MLKARKVDMVIHVLLSLIIIIVVFIIMAKLVILVVLTHVVRVGKLCKTHDSLIEKYCNVSRK